jgi:hypothetical protein
VYFGRWVVFNVSSADQQVLKYKHSKTQRWVGDNSRTKAAIAALVAGADKGYFNSY